MAGANLNQMLTESITEPSRSRNKQKLMLVTGMLGAGKTTALQSFEDIGWEVIDNFPIRLLDRLIENGPSEAAEFSSPLVIGFDSRTRGFVPQKVIENVDAMSERDDLEIVTVFLDCSKDELERRYNETRRRHPMAAASASTGIRMERELLEPLERWSDIVIDTTQMSAKDLQQHIRERFASNDGQKLAVTVSSFGFSRGMPPLADLVFDMRFLDNPHWSPVLRPLTGKDKAVGEHIRKDPGFQDSYEQIRDLLLMLLPRYLAQGKAYVHVAFGCTGGRHRSVFVAEEIASALHDAGFSPTLLHRNLEARGVSQIEEGPKRDE